MFGVVVVAGLIASAFVVGTWTGQYIQETACLRGIANGNPNWLRALEMFRLKVRYENEIKALNNGKRVTGAGE